MLVAAVRTIVPPGTVTPPLLEVMLGPPGATPAVVGPAAVRAAAFGPGLPAPAPAAAPAPAPAESAGAGAADSVRAGIVKNDLDILKIKIEIICKKHGVFLQTPDDHINKKAGCPRCIISKGELEVIKWLDSNHISYTYQKKFDDCLSPKKWPLIFDFYLNDKNIIVEVDGEQHYRPCKIRNHIVSKDQFKWIKIKDQIKNNYCDSKGIFLLRIPYWKKNIFQVLKKTIPIQ